MYSMSEKDDFFALSHWDVALYYYRQNLTYPFWNSPHGEKWRMFFISPAVSAEPTASQQDRHILKQSAPSTFHPCPPGFWHLTSNSVANWLLVFPKVCYLSRGRMILYGRWLKSVWLVSGQLILPTALGACPLRAKEEGYPGQILLPCLCHLGPPWQRYQQGGLGLLAFQIPSTSGLGVAIWFVSGEGRGWKAE